MIAGILKFLDTGLSVKWADIDLSTNPEQSFSYSVRDLNFFLISQYKVCTERFFVR